MSSLDQMLSLYKCFKNVIMSALILTLLTWWLCFQSLFNQGSLAGTACFKHTVTHLNTREHPSTTSVFIYCAAEQLRWSSLGLRALFKDASVAVVIEA